MRAKAVLSRRDFEEIEKERPLADPSILWARQETIHEEPEYTKEWISLPIVFLTNIKTQKTRVSKSSKQDLLSPSFI